jgi:hypothetical protein
MQPVEQATVRRGVEDEIRRCLGDGLKRHREELCTGHSLPILLPNFSAAHVALSYLEFLKWVAIDNGYKLPEHARSSYKIVIGDSVEPYNITVSMPSKINKEYSESPFPFHILTLWHNDVRNRLLRRIELSRFALFDGQKILLSHLSIQEADAITEMLAGWNVVKSAMEPGLYALSIGMPSV